MDQRPRIKTRHPGIYYRVRPDGSKQYMYWFESSDGKAHFKNVPGGEKAAKQARAKVVNDMAHGVKVSPSRVLFQDFAREWLNEQVNLAPNSYSTWKGMIENHLIPRIGRIRVSEVDVNDVASLISYMQAKGKSAGTIRTALGPLSRIMATAVRRGMVAVNPVSQLERSERPRGERAKMNILSTDEIKLLLNNSGAYRLAFATAIFTGLRISELLSLKWEDVDWDNELIRVAGTKTSAAKREVVLMPALRQMLAAHSLQGENVYVFETKKGKRINRSVVSKAHRAALAKAGITKRVRFHDLRHTFASILIHEGFEDTYIAEQMGHSSGAFTRQRYGHLFDGEKRRREARERMQESYGEVLA